MTDLRNYNQKELDVILAFTQKLVDHQTDELVDFDVTDIDLEGADRQAKEYIRKRNAGKSGKVEFEGDAKIRSDIKEWLKRTRRVSKDFF